MPGRGARLGSHRATAPGAGARQARASARRGSSAWELAQRHSRQEQKLTAAAPVPVPAGGTRPVSQLAVVAGN
jgi:hypothetical protein